MIAASNPLTYIVGLHVVLCLKIKIWLKCYLSAVIFNWLMIGLFSSVYGFVMEIAHVIAYF